MQIDPNSDLTPDEIWARDYAPFIPLETVREPSGGQKHLCDILIIGAGPTGVAAADLATRSGAQVVLLDQDPNPGGALNAADPAHTWLVETITKLCAKPNLTLLANTTVYGLKNPQCFLAKANGPENSITIQPKATILATGANPRATKSGGQSTGWNPNLHLACHLGAKPIWNATINAFVPAPNMMPGMFIAGAAGGVFTTKGAMKSGGYRCRLALQSIGINPAPNALPPLPDTE